MDTPLAPAFAAVAANALLFERLLGVESLRARAGLELRDAAAFGVRVSLVLILAAAIAWWLGRLPLDASLAQALRLPGVVAAVGLAVLALQALIDNTAWIGDARQGERLPLAGNTLVLGALVGFGQSGDALGATLLGAATTGLGFALVLVLLAGLRARCVQAEIPAPLRGAPMDLMLLALLALGFAGLSGVERAL
jgi:electron transport complex protein RnfA